VDALLIISNDKLRHLCGDLPLSEAFKRADNVLTTAAKGIAEIITVAGYINVDFEDVKTVMKNSGVAIMGTGVANGPNRALSAVEEALNSPLLDNNDISGAVNLLLYISSGKNEITMDEVTEITDYIQKKTQSTGDIIWGNGFDESLDDKVSVTIIATGFDDDHRHKAPAEPETVRVFDLYNESDPKIEKRLLYQEQETREPVVHLNELPAVPAIPEPEPLQAQPVTEPETAAPVRTIEFSFDKPEPELSQEPTRALVNEIQHTPEQEPAEPSFVLKTKPAAPGQQPAEGDPDDLQTKKASERVSKLRQLSEKLKTHQPIEQNLYEIENIPAYKRRNVELNDVAPSSESQIPGYTLSENNDQSVELRGENKFLNKKVD
jgi:cell division protein FtsZ